MKRSVRPLIGICLLIAVAAILTLRIILRTQNPPHEKPIIPHVFNATLLHYAAVDLGEVRMKQEIEDLVEGNFGGGQGRERSFLSSGKYRIDIRVRSSRGMPVQLHPEFYRLWLEFRRHLQNWAWRRKFNPDVMSDLINSFNDSVFGLGRKYKTCAVVGNSGILLNRNMGDVIDSHEFVIRLNNARVNTYERDVGKKTSVSFVNSNILHLCARREGCYCHPYGEKVPT